MYRRALNGHEKAWNLDYPPMLRITYNLRLLNAIQAEHMKMKDINKHADT